jgi:hypothetical protein
LLRLTVPYIKAGLEDGESCLWITGKPVDEIKNILFTLVLWGLCVPVVLSTHQAGYVKLNTIPYFFLAHD